jgi:hypothetical protein
VTKPTIVGVGIALGRGVGAGVAQACTHHNIRAKAMRIFIMMFLCDCLGTAYGVVRGGGSLWSGESAVTEHGRNEFPET